MKPIKKILLALFIVFLVLQAFRPAKNISNNRSKNISKTYVVPLDVQAILAKACNDCHSNSTRYPWYSEIQPVGWWLADHVKDGKRHLNFDEFDGYTIARQYHKLEECIEEVKKGSMPLPSYTITHKDAVLTAAEKESLYKWCDLLRETIRENNPPDSLVTRRK
ncbi:heme-binding domain-containing protein [Sediminibacterium roseum]|uniref:Heme-binding domain-containing protein n=1 Tax=Sediminibacterium roseum TaxID=1978412 RepID=A0ABW9ZUD9_9BACT|nr:heme-binding domain-containing protein [Sediminibacterium roseum]NCI48833.1 heme-binding domain-containing protein [Sediminibacterium roseum]